jgi:hypothetical protein
VANSAIPDNSAPCAPDSLRANSSRPHVINDASSLCGSGGNPQPICTCSCPSGGNSPPIDEPPNNFPIVNPEIVPGPPGTGGGGGSGGSCGCSGTGGGNPPPVGGPPPTFGPNPPTMGNPTLPRAIPFIQISAGGGHDALGRAASLLQIASNKAIPPVSLSTGGCNSLGGGCVVNPATGNLMLQTSPPACDSFYIPPLLSFTSTNLTATEFGNGWTSVFSRVVITGGSGAVRLLTGAGNTYNYSGTSWTGGYYPPSSGSSISPNSLYSAASPCLG